MRYVNDAHRVLANLTFAQMVALASSRTPANQEFGQRIINLLNIEAKKALRLNFTESDEVYRERLLTSICNEIEEVFL